MECGVNRRILAFSVVAFLSISTLVLYPCPLFAAGLSSFGVWKFANETELVSWQESNYYSDPDYFMGMMYGPNRISQIDIPYGSTDWYLLHYAYLSDSGVPMSIDLSLTPENTDDNVWGSIAALKEGGGFLWEINFNLEDEIHSISGSTSGSAWMLFKPEDGNVWINDFRTKARFLENTGGQVNTAVVGSMRFDVSTVPIPGTFWLFVPSLLGLIGIRKKACG